MEKHLPIIIVLILGGAIIYWTIKVLTGVVIAMAPMLVTGVVFLVAIEIYNHNKGRRR
jgi:hypothetical protein